MKIRVVIDDGTILKDGDLSTALRNNIKDVSIDDTIIWISEKVLPGPYMVIDKQWNVKRDMITLIVKYTGDTVCDDNSSTKFHAHEFVKNTVSINSIREGTIGFIIEVDLNKPTDRIYRVIYMNNKQNWMTEKEIKKIKQI